MSDKAVITCALNGVLTDPKQHNVPVTPEQMAREARAAFDAGASIMHIHLRQQAPNKGHLPSWEVGVSKEIQQAIREACPGVIINHTSGVSGPNYSGALDCIRETKPEIAACNAGSLNYLKVKADNTWAWPPMMFDNAVEKVKDYLDVMNAVGTIPEFECFDVGIVRCVGMYTQVGMYKGPLEYNFVDGRRLRHAVGSRPVADPDQAEASGGALAGHGDRPRGDLAAAPALRRARRSPAHRPRRHLLSRRRHEGDVERPAHRSRRRLCPPRRPRDRKPRRGAEDLWDESVSHTPSFRDGPKGQARNP
ncbi:hypothetical protein ACVIHC_006148 [Bradyrhizobium diazoefficiens]